MQYHLTLAELYASVLTSLIKSYKLEALTKFNEALTKVTKHIMI